MRYERYERLWERLLIALDDWTSAREVRPGRIEVTVPDASAGERQVQIVMTSDEWDDMASVAFGGFEYAFDHVKDRLVSMGASETFAVYSFYDLVPSTTPELPEDPEELRLDELAREHPEGFGRWVALDDASTIQSEFKPPA